MQRSGLTPALYMEWDAVKQHQKQRCGRLPALQGIDHRSYKHPSLYPCKNLFDRGNETEPCAKVISTTGFSFV